MERSDERLSTRDIASPSAADTDTERDAAPVETSERAERFERAERDHEDGGAVAAERAEPVGDGDVVTDEPVEDRAASRESIGDPAAAAPAPADTTATRADSGTGTDTGTGTRRDSSTDGDAAPLLADSDAFQSRWEEIQVRFVDEPRGAVEDADALVATVMQRLAEGFAQERERLEAQWGRGEDISTEDLRVALQRYRSFFQRLLST